MGSFADNMGSFMTGLTGKILQEKETQDKIKIDNDKAALGMKLNLFGDMLGNPDKYSANDLQLMGSTILKDHKLPQVFPGAEEYVQQLIQGRQNDVKTYKDNENLKQMFPGDPNSLSPAQVNAAYASLFSEGRADARADKTYKLQSEARLAERQYLDEAARKENEENWKRHRETQADLRGVEWRRGIASGYEAEQNRITELERAKITAEAYHNQKIPLTREQQADAYAEEVMKKVPEQILADPKESDRIFNAARQSFLRPGSYRAPDPYAGMKPPQKLSSWNTFMGAFGSNTPPAASPNAPLVPGAAHTVTPGRSRFSSLLGDRDNPTSWW